MASESPHGFLIGNILGPDNGNSPMWIVRISSCIFGGGGLANPQRVVLRKVAQLVTDS